MCTCNLATESHLDGYRSKNVNMDKAVSIWESYHNFSSYEPHFPFRDLYAQCSLILRASLMSRLDFVESVAIISEKPKSIE